MTYGRTRSIPLGVDARDGLIYLRVESQPEQDAERAIVEVDAQAFLLLFQGTPGNDSGAGVHPIVLTGSGDFVEAKLRTGLPVRAPVVRVETIRRDGGARYLRCNDESQREPDFRITIEEGLATLIWLFANGAMTFPVECTVADATTLVRAAANRTFPRTVADLLNAQ